MPASPVSEPAQKQPQQVAAVELRDVVAGYYVDQPVLQGLNLSCAPERATALLGPNGAGKSTALRVIVGLLPPLSGSVLLFGHDVTGVSAHDLAHLGVAFLPQGRSTFGELSVYDNLELGTWWLGRRRRKVALEEIFDRYPQLREQRRMPAGRLSGGQQRLLEISRALVSDPKVVVVDEPSVGLSPILANQSYEELRRLKREGRTVVIVDQNVRPAIAMADYIYSLRAGRTEREGSSDELTSDLSELVREWLGVEEAGQGGGGAGAPGAPNGAGDDGGAAETVE